MEFKDKMLLKLNALSQKKSQYPKLILDQKLFQNKASQMNKY